MKQNHIFIMVINNVMPMIIDERKGQYRRIFRRFVLLTLVSSLVPLSLVGWQKKDGAVQKDMMNEIQKVVESLKSVFEVFLKKRR